MVPRAFPTYAIRRPRRPGTRSDGGDGSRRAGRAGAAGSRGRWRALLSRRRAAIAGRAVEFVAAGGWRWKSTSRGQAAAAFRHGDLGPRCDDRRDAVAIGGARSVPEKAHLRAAHARAAVVEDRDDEIRHLVARMGVSASAWALASWSWWAGRRSAPAAAAAGEQGGEQPQRRTRARYHALPDRELAVAGEQEREAPSMSRRITLSSGKCGMVSPISSSGPSVAST